MAVILWSTRLYIIFWIILGATSLAFGAIQNLDTSNPLYTTGQTWLGIAVTIGYAYFGLSGKSAPKADTDTFNIRNDQRPNGTDQIITDGGGDSDTSPNTMEARFTDQDGKTRVLKTYHELMKDIDTYNELKEKASADRRFQNAAGYQMCLEQLYKLKPLFPTVAELENQLKDAEAEMNAAANVNKFDSAEKLSVIVEELQERIQEEKNEEEKWLSGNSAV